MKLRSNAAPLILLLEPLQECVALGAAAKVAAGLLLQTDLLTFSLFHVLAWMLADWTLLSIMQVAYHVYTIEFSLIKPINKI